MIEKSPRSSLIRLAPEDGLLRLETQNGDGSITCKDISPLDFYFSLCSGMELKGMVPSGFLPAHCLHVSIMGDLEELVIWNPDLRADLAYLEKKYPDFPIPRLVFRVQILGTGRVTSCSVGVVADEVPTPDTKMFFYPFANVYPDGRVCSGNNILPKYKDLRSLERFPQYLLAIPDNDDMYDMEKNRLRLGHAELMEHLRDKEPSYYYSDVLIPNGKTLGEFISRR